MRTTAAKHDSKELSVALADGGKPVDRLKPTRDMYEETSLVRLQEHLRDRGLMFDDIFADRERTNKTP